MKNGIFLVRTLLNVLLLGWFSPIYHDLPCKQRSLISPPRVEYGVVVKLLPTFTENTSQPELPIIYTSNMQVFVSLGQGGSTQKGHTIFIPTNFRPQISLFHAICEKRGKISNQVRHFSLFVYTDVNSTKEELQCSLCFIRQSFPNPYLHFLEEMLRRITRLSSTAQ